MTDAPSMASRSREGDGDVDAGVGAGPVGDHLRADEELAALLEGVVVALPGGAEVLRPAALAEGLEDGGDGGGALGGQVAADPPGAVHGGLEVQVPVAESPPAGVVVRVGLLRPPGLVGGLGDELEVVEVRPGGGGLDEDLVGLGLEFVVVDPAGPPGDLPRPRDGERPGGGRGVEEGVAGEQAHLADGGLGVLGPEAVPGGEPGGSWWRSRRRRARNRRRTGAGGRWGGAEQRGDRPELLQRLAAGGAVEVGGGRGVEVRAEGARPTRSASATLANPGRGRPGRIPPRLACTS